MSTTGPPKQTTAVACDCHFHSSDTAVWPRVLVNNAAKLYG